MSTIKNSELLAIIAETRRLHDAHDGSVASWNLVSGHDFGAARTLCNAVERLVAEAELLKEALRVTAREETCDTCGALVTQFAMKDHCIEREACDACAAKYSFVTWVDHPHAAAIRLLSDVPR